MMNEKENSEKMCRKNEIFLTGLPAKGGSTTEVITHISTRIAPVLLRNSR